MIVMRTDANYSRLMRSFLFYGSGVSAERSQPFFHKAPSRSPLRGLTLKDNLYSLRK